MSTHNICFRREIRKIFTGYPPLSRPMGISDSDSIMIVIILHDTALFCMILHYFV